MIHVKMIQQILHIHGVPGDPVAARNLLRLPVSSHIHTDHLKMSGQLLHIVFPELSGTGPAREHKQRRSLTGYLIIDLHIVIGLKCCHKIPLLAVDSYIISPNFHSYNGLLPINLHILVR